jgi:MYXO-CTERM domain-containing protein
MRALSFAFLLLPSIALADVATDSATATDTDAGSDCAAEGDACTAEDGHEGTCDAELVCVHEEEGGCNTSGAPVAGGVTLLSLGLLGLRRSRKA